MQSHLLAQDQEYQSDIRLFFNELFKGEGLGDFLVEGDGDNLNMVLGLLEDDEVMEFITEME